MINNKYRLSAATFLFAGLSIVAVAGMAYTCTDLHLGVATDKLFVFTCLVMFSFLGAVLVWREYRRLDYAVLSPFSTTRAETTWPAFNTGTKISSGEAASQP